MKYALGPQILPENGKEKDTKRGKHSSSIETFSKFLAYPFAVWQVLKSPYEVLVTSVGSLTCGVA